MRTNKRRNLNSGQWACIAAEADDLLAVIREKVEREKAQRVSEARQGEVTQKIVQPAQPKQDRETSAKAAELFNTNLVAYHAVEPPFSGAYPRAYLTSKSMHFLAFLDVLPTSKIPANPFKYNDCNPLQNAISSLRVFCSTN
jgi:hypothetical protein